MIENDINYTPAELTSTFEDWKTYNGNRWEIQAGLRFSLFNKSLKLVTSHN